MASRRKHLAFAAFAALGIGFAQMCSAPAQEAVVFRGMCDASAAAAIDEARFVVADDEDNILRVFSREGGAAISEFDVSGFLGNEGKKKPKEADLEAAAPLGGHVYWVASHGRNAKGKSAPARQRLFATRFERQEDGKVRVVPVGQPYRGLLQELIEDPRLAEFDLGKAAAVAPKAPGGLNIEGLASTPEGHLLIGFRSPAPGKRALLVPLLNPGEILEGAAAKFGAPITLDLQGQGIRSIERVGARYIIIAGSVGDSAEPAHVFQWNGKDEPRLIPGITLRGLNPEGVAFHRNDGEGEFFVLSDDGTREIEGKDCKDLKDPALKSFRGRTLDF